MKLYRWKWTGSGSWCKIDRKDVHFISIVILKFILDAFYLSILQMTLNVTTEYWFSYLTIYSPLSCHRWIIWQTNASFGWGSSLPRTKTLGLSFKKSSINSCFNKKITGKISFIIKSQHILQSLATSTNSLLS